MVSFKINRRGRQYVPEGRKVTTAESSVAVSQPVLTPTPTSKRVRQEDGDAVVVQLPAVRDLDQKSSLIPRGCQP